MDKSSIRDWDWFSAVLLFGMLQVAAARLIIADWAPFLYFAEILTALGTVLGLALGASRFNKSMITLLVIDYTVVVLPWQWTMAAQAGLDLYFRDQLHLVASRLGIALTQFLQRAPVEDSFFFVAFASLTMWLISLVAAYQLMRHDNLLATILPSGVVIILVQVYDNHFTLRSWWLAVYFLIALFLLGRRYFLRHRIEWRRQHVAISEDAWPDILNGLTVTTLTVVFISWIIPTSLSSLQAASDAWRNVSNPLQNQLSNAVISLQSPYSNGGANFYSESLSLGLNAAQGDQSVFTVRVLASPAVRTPYYWRARVYDRYANGQWSNSSVTSLDFEPANPSLSLVNAQNRSQAQFEFTMQMPPQSLLYAPSEPVWADQAGSVVVTPVNEGESDPIAWFADPSIARGGRYQVRAEIAAPTVSELDAAGMTYPAWIESRYLDVPQNIRPAFQTLAQEITYGKTTPYDKAQAITQYLRDTIQYSTTVPSPPTGEDPAAFVLFDYKKGFCNYYASAEVLMLRSIGIPARLAVGFAEGEYSNEVPGTHNQEEVYIVRQRDAHAWPEVYFPDMGWVEFEPTVNQNAIVRPASRAQIADQQNNNASSGSQPNKPVEAPSSESNTSTASTVWNRLLHASLILIISLMVIGLLVFTFRRYRFLDRVPVYLSDGLERIGMSTPAWINGWMNWNQMSPAEHSFASINLGLRWLGSPQPVSATAAERAAELIKLLPEAKPYIETVAFEHQAALFTTRPADVSQARQAGWMIVFHVLRFTVLKFWNGISGSDVYSG